MSFKLKALILIVLLLLNTVVVFFLIQAQAPPVLKVSILDIGQGDSILIQSPTGTTVLIDGGPDQSVLRQLPREIGPFRRNIDLVVETHPDADHITGLVSVFDRYRVENFLSSKIPDTTNISHALDTAVTTEPGIRTLVARRGMRIELGGGAYADVLFPDRDESMQTKTNDGSVVLHVVYGKTSFMLTGDLPSTYEDYLVALDGKDMELQSDVLKAGHHGSKYSTDAAWLAAVHPKVVAISAGKDNRYGHPSPDALARISSEGAQILSTIDRGTIDFLSDGVSVREKTEK